jgi:hypothetical protein
MARLLSTIGLLLALFSPAADEGQMRTDSSLIETVELAAA